jgi:hypothetical protein
MKPTLNYGGKNVADTLILTWNFRNSKHIPTLKELNVFPLDGMSVTSFQDTAAQKVSWIGMTNNNN